MDFALRCNSLKCRTQLNERAVVTTCSHVFCDACSHALGLTAPPGENRVCPACQSSLPNPDDAVSTSLNPTEDYKTSVLSGLSPSTIMECAGRGLAFWSYQSTQEIVYQEYLAKTLTDKYSNLNVQMDKMVNDANSELEMLTAKLNNMQIDQDRLKTENANLVAAFREKSRKHQQTQELYDRLKRKEMTAATQNAAFDSVDEVLGNVSSRPGYGHLSSSQHQAMPGPEGQRGFQPFAVNDSGIERVSRHQRSGDDHSGNNGGMMQPPPLRRPGGLHNTTLGYSNNAPTPSNHRTQLGPITQSAGGAAPGHHSTGVGDMQNATPVHRQPFANLNLNSVSRLSLSGYGMRAGLKVGRQEAPRLNNSSSQARGIDHAARVLTQAQQFGRDSNAYY